MDEPRDTSLLDRLRARWSRGELEYVRLLATTLLAIALVPLVLFRLLTNPSSAVDRALGAAVR